MGDTSSNATTTVYTTAIPLINIVLAETFDVNNRIRYSKDKAELTACPTITALTDTLTYEDELTRFALPLGLLCRLYVDEDNLAMLSVYKQEYAAAVNNADRCIASFV
jgi:hypothetical protein